MLIKTSDRRIIYKKLKRLLASFFIDIEIVKFLSKRKLSKLLWRITKYDDNFNYTKKEIKQLSKEIIEFNFNEKNIKQESRLVDFIAFVLVEKIKQETFEFDELSLSNYVSRFYTNYPLTLE